MYKKHPRTNIFIINNELWAWAQYKTKLLGLRSTSEYIFQLIEKDKKLDLKINDQK